MQRLEVSGAVRPLHGSLRIKGLIPCKEENSRLFWELHGVFIYAVCTPLGKFNVKEGI